MSDPSPYCPEAARQEAEWDWFEQEQRQKEETMSKPFHEKSMPEKLRELSDDAGDLQAWRLEDTLDEIADTLETLLKLVHEAFRKPLDHPAGETYVAEMHMLDEAAEAVMEAMEGTATATPKGKP